MMWVGGVVLYKRDNTTYLHHPVLVALLELLKTHAAVTRGVEYVEHVCYPLGIYSTVEGGLAEYNY